MMTEEQRNITLTPMMFRRNGFCFRGAKNYADNLGINFKDLKAGKLKVKDLEPFQKDPFVRKLFDSILGK